jgi:hypothetical protein
VSSAVRFRVALEAELDGCQLLKSTLLHEVKTSVTSRINVIRRRIHFGNAYYFEALMLLPSCALYRMMKIMMYRTIFLPVIKYWYHMVSQFEGRTEIGSI